MDADFIETLRGFLTNPVESFRKSRGDSFAVSFRYYIILVILFAVLSTIIATLIGPAGMVIGLPGALSAILPAFQFIYFIVFSIVAWLVFGLWVHLWVYVFGGRKGITRTINAVYYGNTPYLLIGWIPFVGIIGIIWSAVLWIVGIREMQEISTGKAVAAVIIPVAIIIIIAALIAAYFIATLIGITPLGPMYSPEPVN
jgi:hypothetical protein